MKKRLFPRRVRSLPSNFLTFSLRKENFTLKSAMFTQTHLVIRLHYQWLIGFFWEKRNTEKHHNSHVLDLWITSDHDAYYSMRTSLHARKCDFKQVTVLQMLYKCVIPCNINTRLMLSKIRIHVASSYAVCPTDALIDSASRTMF